MAPRFKTTMEIVKFAITLTGTTPLLTHNAQLSDPFNPIVRQMKVITAKRSKQTDEDRMQLARLEFEGGLYYSPELGPVMPSKNLVASILNAAKATRERPAVTRAGLSLDALQYRLGYEGPRDIDGLWGDGSSPFVSRESVANQAARVMRTRALFTEWSVPGITAEIDISELNPERFVHFLAYAGQKVGLGDWRPEKNGPYGKFAVDVEEL